VTHRWKCRFSYVGGTQRTKEGAGIVIDGSEKAIRSDNPLDALAYQPVFDAIQLFNAGLPAAAEKLLEPVSKRSDLDPSVKRSVMAVVHVLRAYAKWDAFQHGDAVTSFDNAIKSQNDLAAILPHGGLLEQFKAHKRMCENLKDSGAKPTLELVTDLVSNADRRAALGQHDDAVARLYRAIEAFAQASLIKQGIDTGHVPADKIPEEIRTSLHAAADKGFYKLGLQDAFKLLRALDPKSAAPFFDEMLDAETSQLVARNQSILAHGFQPISEKTFKSLRNVTETLLRSINTMSFPKLPSP
jgi:CRISPR-associated protein (TIGR02710 family)